MLKRIIAIVLALCLLPLWALAEEVINDGTPVTRSEYELTFQLHADGFPQDGLAHYADWETFLSKLGVRGVIDVQSFLKPLSRVRMDAALTLNGQERVPFAYDGYYWFRYLRSPATNNEIVHFQMQNFFQFMLKPYYYMGLPTNYLAVLLYPEATTDLLMAYGEPLMETVRGEGSRKVSYKRLKALAQELTAYAVEDENDKLEYYLSVLLSETGLNYLLMDKLCAVDSWLEFLDPKHKGLIISADADGETWTLGETIVFEKHQGGWSFFLPDEEGYALTASLEQTESDWQLQFGLLLNEEPFLVADIAVDGLDVGEGVASFAASGDALWQEATPIRFAYQFERTADALPYHVSLTADWLHPETDRPALGFAYKAQVSELPVEELTDREADPRQDFFNLNESFMEEYKERFGATLMTAFLPFVLEVPDGVISDLMSWGYDWGILAFLGLE